MNRGKLNEIYVEQTDEVMQWTNISRLVKSLLPFINQSEVRRAQHSVVQHFKKPTPHYRDSRQRSVFSFLALSVCFLCSSFSCTDERARHTGLFVGTEKKYRKKYEKKVSYGVLVLLLLFFASRNHNHLTIVLWGLHISHRKADQQSRKSISGESVETRNLSLLSWAIKLLIKRRHEGKKQLFLDCVCWLESLYKNDFKVEKWFLTFSVLQTRIGRGGQQKFCLWIWLAMLSGSAIERSGNFPTGGLSMKVYSNCNNRCEEGIRWFASLIFGRLFSPRMCIHVAESFHTQFSSTSLFLRLFDKVKEATLIEKQSRKLGEALESFCQLRAFKSFGQRHRLTLLRKERKQSSRLKN